MTAKAKYGHSIEFGMRTAEAGVTAVRQGKRVLGFGFIDTEELGFKIAQALLRELNSEAGEAS